MQFLPCAERCGINNAGRGPGAQGLVNVLRDEVGEPIQARKKDGKLQRGHPAQHTPIILLYDRDSEVRIGKTTRDANTRVSTVRKWEGPRT